MGGCCGRPKRKKEKSHQPDRQLYSSPVSYQIPSTDAQPQQHHQQQQPVHQPPQQQLPKQQSPQPKQLPPKPRRQQQQQLQQEKQQPPQSRLPPQKQTSSPRAPEKAASFDIPPESATLSEGPDLPFGWFAVRGGPMPYFNAVTLESSDKPVPINPSPYATRQGGPYYEDDILRCANRIKTSAEDWTEVLDDLWADLKPQSKEEVALSVRSLDAGDRNNSVALWIWMVQRMLEATVATYEKHAVRIRREHRLDKNASLRHLSEYRAEGGWKAALGIPDDLSDEIRHHLLQQQSEASEAEEPLWAHLCGKGSQFARVSLNIMAALCELLFACPLVKPDLRLAYESVGQHVPLKPDVHIKLAMVDKLASKNRCYIIFPAIVDRYDSRAVFRPLCAGS
eukprot:TRINITY_DN2817_c0_g1_i2.p1 TRINITY_DN2817_c0_g1~~TRINITY_DN2817_c0_g1_i2.p1  ORF type:complete len:395 (+),score=95.80 TRINITY_DN2817_c0_g1_i2:46-1230(+)